MKSVGPGGGSGFILKNCREQLVRPVYDLMKCLLSTGKVPKEWKRAKIKK